MKDIAIFGAGGFGREVACLIKRINDTTGDWNLIGFFDDGIEKDTQISHIGKVLGGIDELNKYPSQLAIVIAIGNPESIFLIRNRISNSKVYYPNLIDPTFKIVDVETFNLGIGNIIQTDCIASCNVTIGSFNVLNGSVAMGHDVTIADYNVIMPNIRISGNVSIGMRNMLGVGSIILQNIKIGNQVHLGAGAVLMTKPKDGFTYIGNPARIFKY